MEATELIRSLCERLGIGYEPDDNGGSCSFEADGLLVMINNLRNLDQIAIVGDLGDPPPEKLETLYKEAYTIKGPKDRTKVADDTAGSADGKVLYCMQNDNSFGKTNYRMEIH